MTKAEVATALAWQFASRKQASPVVFETLTFLSDSLLTTRGVVGQTGGARHPALFSREGMHSTTIFLKSHTVVSVAEKLTN